MSQIRTKAATEEYRRQWDWVFNRPRCPECGAKMLPSIRLCDIYGIEDDVLEHKCPNCHPEGPE